MKRNLLHFVSALMVLCGTSLIQSTQAQTIDCFPYLQTFDDWNTCSSTCGAPCTAEDGWFNALDDTQDWTTWSGGTTSGSTGPSGDHTSGSGNYLYFETSVPCSGFDDTAHVETPEIDLTSAGLTDMFMAYWQHLFGATINTLHIDVRTFTAGNPNPWQLNVVPAQTANVNAWVPDTVNLTPFLGNVIQVRFRATSGSSFTGDIAIDDVEFYTTLTLDAGISNIDAPSGAITPGTQNVDVTVTNYGSTTLTSGTINWELNGAAQAPFAYTGSLASGASQSGVTIGTANIPSGNSTIKVWITAPNSGTDVQPCNDTSEVSLCTAYRGVFTVGAGQTWLSPDEALEELSICGIDSHVVLNVLPGVYNEQVIVEEIPGAADTATVCVNGGDTSLVTITNNNLATVFYDGGDWVTFKNIYIENTGTSNGYGVHFLDQSDHNNIDSCLIWVTPNTSSLMAGVLFSNSPTSSSTSGPTGQYNLISNNTIINGYYGIRMQGDISTHQRNNHLVGNDISESYFYSIWAQYQDSIEIIRNICSQRSNNLNADGIFLFDSENFAIIENDVSDANDYGIQVTDGNFDFPSSRRGRIINNFISSQNDRALNLDDVNDTDIWHNTCYGTWGIYVNDLQQCDIRNNIFVGSAQYPFFSLDPGTVLPIICDYNLYWTQPGALGIASVGGTVYPDLPTWQAGFAFFNADSREGDPVFVNGLFDMHVASPLANNNGDSLGVPIDIDGDVRPFPGDPDPDIGADEFFLPPVDAGITALDNPSAPLTAGVQNVEVTIFNFGTDTLTSATINWEVNGLIQPPFFWTGNLPSGTSQSNVALGSFNFPSGFTDFSAWTTVPNGGTDGNNSNDTLQLRLCTGLSGIYTVGAGQNYLDLQDALDDLINCGVAGAVTFDIQPGTYPTSLIIPEISGASSANTITFDGNDTSLVTITNNNLANFRLEGADWFRFRNMTIEHTGTTNAYGIQFADSANNNIVDSCYVVVPSSTSTLFAPISFSNTPTSATASGQNGNFNTISNNVIERGYYGIRVQGDLNNHQSGNRVIDNEFIDQVFFPIYYQYQDSLEIIGNDVGTTTNTGGDGISVFDSEDFIIEENDVTEAADYGIAIQDGNFDNPSTFRARVINNFISSNSDRALYFDDCNDIDVFHNTCYGTYGIYVNDINGLEIRNNIFVGTQFAPFFSLDAFTVLGSSFIDYNAYFKDGAANVATGGGVNYVDLPAWQAGVALYNVNSVEGNPVFVSTPDDLHVLGGTVNDVGDNGVGVTVDIDGDTRPQAPSTTVDIGADEFTPLNNDAAFLELLQPGPVACGDSMTPVIVVVQNLGAVATTNIPVTVNVTGDITTTLNGASTDTLNFLESDTIVLGFINTYAGFNNVNFGGFTVLPGDQNTSNDTLSPMVTSTFVPFVPQATPMSGCGTDSADLVGAVWPGAGYQWFASDTASTPVGSGPSFTIPSLAAQSTYWVQYAQNSDSLETTFAGGNGQSGNFFDIEAISTTTITGFAGNFDQASAANVEIWYRTSSYQGNIASNAGWIQVTGSPFALPGTNGPGQSTTVTQNLSITIPAGQTYGFLFLATTNSLDYTNGTAEGNVFATNGQINLLEGRGVGTPGFGVGTFQPRVWNGRIFFGTDACSNVRVPVTGFVGQAANVDLGPDFDTCATSAVLDAGNPTGTSSYLWNSGAMTQTDTVTASGAYYVDITDTAGCPATDTINVTLNDPPVLPAGQDTLICASDSITLDAGNPGSTYNWSNQASTQMVTVPGGNYTVTITDSNGCVTTDSIAIATSAPQVDLGPDTTLCNGASIALDAGPATSYNWSTMDSVQVITVNQSATYSVTATDSIGCTTTDDVVVSTEVSPTSAYTFLVGAAGLTYDFTYTGTAGTNFVWDFGDGSPAGSGANPTHTYAASGNYTVCLTVDNDCGTDSICQNLGVVNLDGGLIPESVEVFPNPNNGTFTLALTSYELSDVDVEIYSLRGKVVYRKRYEDLNGTMEEHITLERVATGIYFVRLTSGNKIVTRKMTIE